MNILRWIKNLLVCNHDWQHIDTIKEQNLRGGYEHWSDVYVCKKCGKYRSEEMAR